MCETRDIEHAKMLKEMLNKNYKEVVFGEIPSPSSLAGGNASSYHDI